MFSKERRKTILQSTPIPSLFLIFLGSMDCLTTVIGTLYYGTREINPILAGLVNSDLPAFVILKLAITVSVGLILILSQETLSKYHNKNSLSFKVVLQILKIAYVGIILFLAIVVANNLLVLFKIIV